SEEERGCRAGPDTDTANVQQEPAISGSGVEPHRPDVAAEWTRARAANDDTQREEDRPEDGEKRAATHHAPPESDAIDRVAEMGASAACGSFIRTSTDLELV